MTMCLGASMRISWKQLLTLRAVGGLEALPEDLVEMNRHIVGLIEVIGEYKGETKR